MFKLFRIILRRDLMLAFRRKSDLAQVIFFFAVVVTLVPLGVGAETNILRSIAPGVVWDARLTSELILFFLYLGFIALHSAIDDKRRADRAASVISIVGVINVPIIYFSVQWWNTLHQGASITSRGSSIAPIMLYTLLIMVVAGMCYGAGMVLARTRYMNGHGYFVWCAYGALLVAVIYEIFSLRARRAKICARLAREARAAKSTLEM